MKKVPLHASDLAVRVEKKKGSPIRAGVNRQNGYVLNFLVRGQTILLPNVQSTR